MHAAAFFLADHASVESGKVYANGAFWNRLNFPTYHKVGDDSIIPLAMPVSNIVLERAGDNAAVLAIDGAEVSRWHFGALQFADFW